MQLWWNGSDSWAAGIPDHTADRDDLYCCKAARAQYEKWLSTDMEAFRLEVRLTCASLLEEERKNRLYLFLEGADRLAVLFVDWYEKYSKNEVLCVNESRQNMADETGLCLKSITRSIKKFQAEQLICKKGNQIMINREQYEGLRQSINEKIGRC